MVRYQLNREIIRKYLWELGIPMSVIIQFIATVISKILSKLFSLATVTFMGRMPSKDDSKVSLSALLSFYWLILCVGLILPSAVKSFIPFAPDDKTTIRFMTAGLVLLIPLIVGWVTTRIENYKDKSSRSFPHQLLMGYPYTMILGFLVVSLIITVPILKAPYIIYKNYLDSIKVMIHKGNFEKAILQVQQILTEREIRTKVETPPAIMQWLFKLLVWIEGEIFHQHMSKEMKVLKGEFAHKDFQINIYASDIAIIGKRSIATKIRAILSEELDEQNMYFSWDVQAHKIEDQIREYQQALSDEEEIPFTSIKELNENLKSLSLSEEEWNAIRRQLYQLESEILKKMYNRIPSIVTAEESTYVE
ncbi:hypothetical protein [Metabacillus arenae]|uniref:Uncharacterized protein n=1 Tax=Metabacillus arenae TaxID=2771434 RepID=A0A926NH71_9BACI|nr:hypothetical protein [Metabacillus arenae]MBD1380730.1 hypothetical protein [Metabacillus arenae]